VSPGARLRDSPLTRTLKIEDNWPIARDIRIAVRPFAWLDLLVLVENHGDGRSLIRVGHRLRPAALTIIGALAIVAWTIVFVRGDLVIPWWVASAGGIAGFLLAGAALWRVTRTQTVAKQLIAELAMEIEMQPIPRRFAWWRSRARPSAAPMTPRGDEV
jgi:hypothetical protein